ncbi:cellulose biosynthesis cyclic di-GMP-binding regulatory protein BcsB, partial [Xenophilus sp.]
NQQRVRRIDLASNDEDVRRAFETDDSAVNRTIPLPLSMLESQAGLQFQFLYPPPVQAECRGAYIDVRRSAIDPRSTIDLSGLPHHKAMPDLAAFGTSGFPFTRMADLSDTVVVLPASPGEHELSAFLSLLGKMGQVTGYPATDLSVVRDAEELHDKDVLLLEAGGRSDLLSQWAGRLPVAQRARSFSADSDSFAAWVSTFADWVGRMTHRGASAGSVAAPAGGAYLAGFESPVSRGRSVVVFAGADGRSLLSAVDLLIFDEEQKSRLQGGLAVVRDGRIESLSDAKSYHVGNMGPYQTVSWFLSSHPLILFVLYLLAAVLIAIVLYLSLRARAQRRLRVGRPDSR